MGSSRRRTTGRPPAAILVLAAIGLAFVALPFVALLAKAPWSDFGHVLSDPLVRDALRLSLLCALAATGLSVVLGVPIAWLLARVDFYGRSVVRALVLLPMLLTPVVGGVGLLYALGRRGLVGGWLYDRFGLLLPFTWRGVVLAETFVAMPFLIITVEAALRAADPRFEEAAATLGAGPWQRFWRVTLPMAAPSVVAGAVLCWARALGEFGATITFNGNLAGRTQTVPLAVYLALEQDRDAAIALSLVLVVVAVGVLVALRDPLVPRAMTEGLDATVGVMVGTFDLDVSLRAPRGEVVAVLGPNGAGKTTLLRVLAGLRPLDHGRIELDGVALDDPAKDVWIDPETRAVGYVFQDYVLFPHLSALDNVAFGLRARGAAKADARERAATALADVGLEAAAIASKPAALSGGQAQRVALARALVTSPRLLLLDEPLAALDASTRLEVRRQLRVHLTEFDGVPIVVTHDPVEALAIADRLVVIERGRVVQTGPPVDVAAHPRTDYVADLVGLNLFRGIASGSQLTVDGGGSIAFAGALAGPAFATVHPRAVSLHREHPEGSPRNVWPGRVAEVSLEHDRVRVQVQATPPIVAEVTPAALAELSLGVGGDVWVAVKATEVNAYGA